jgi:hypothetical protein
MQFHGQVEQLQASAPPDEEGITSGRAVDSVVYNDTSAFCLTDAGLVFAEEIMALVIVHGHEGGIQDARDSIVLGRLLPKYDRGERVLHWGRHVVKHFRQPADNQVLLVMAEAEGWPHVRICGRGGGATPAPPRLNPQRRPGRPEGRLAPLLTVRLARQQ